MFIITFSAAQNSEIINFSDRLFHYFNVYKQNVLPCVAFKARLIFDPEHWSNFYLKEVSLIQRQLYKKREMFLNQQLTNYYSNYTMLSMSMT